MDFSKLKEGDRFEYCFDGAYTVTKAFKSGGKTVKITAKAVNGGDPITLGPNDADFISAL